MLVIILNRYKEELKFNEVELLKKTNDKIIIKFHRGFGKKKVLSRNTNEVKKCYDCRRWQLKC